MLLVPGCRQLIFVSFFLDTIVDEKPQPGDHLSHEFPNPATLFRKESSNLFGVDAHASLFPLLR